MGAPSLIMGLVERFCEHIDSYQSVQYNEAQLRQEFINPFFEKLVDAENTQKIYATQRNFL